MTLLGTIAAHFVASAPHSFVSNGSQALSEFGPESGLAPLLAPLLAQGGGGGGSNPILLFGYIAFFLAFMYFFMMRPQARQAKERQAMLDTVKKGSRVIFAGGIYGTVKGEKEREGNQHLVVKIADNVDIEISRDAVNGVVGKDK